MDTHRSSHNMVNLDPQSFDEDMPMFPKVVVFLDLPQGDDPASITEREELVEDLQDASWNRHMQDLQHEVDYAATNAYPIRTSWGYARSYRAAFHAFPPHVVMPTDPETIQLPVMHDVFGRNLVVLASRYLDAMETKNIRDRRYLEIIENHGPGYMEQPSHLVFKLVCESVLSFAPYCREFNGLSFVLRSHFPPSYELFLYYIPWFQRHYACALGLCCHMFLEPRLWEAYCCRGHDWIAFPAHKACWQAMAKCPNIPIPVWNGQMTIEEYHRAIDCQSKLKFKRPIGKPERSPYQRK